MRVEVSVVLPTTDSYGRSVYYSKVSPNVDQKDVRDCMFKALEGFIDYQPGMEIEILIKEDWTYQHKK